MPGHENPSSLFVHEMDQQLVEQMVRFALKRFGDRREARLSELFSDPDETIQLFAPWLVYHDEIDGKPEERRSICCSKTLRTVRVVCPKTNE
ncbi:MAG: hypothetical protein GY850_22375 [bacterium]|nr:hypothetical protein [bacterium]